MCFPDDCTCVCLNFEALRHRTVVYGRIFAFVRATQALWCDHVASYSQILEYPALEAI